MIQSHKDTGDLWTTADDELIEACRHGDSDAWSALIDKYRRLIFSIPMRLGLSADEANDIFQEVCLKLLSEVPKIREPKALPAWLIRVTSRECMHWKQAWQTHEDDASSSATPTSADLPDRLLEELEQEQALRDAICELCPRCQRLILMLFFSVPPMPYEDVAKSLGIATGSVGFIRMRCLSRLRRRLGTGGVR